MRLDLSKMKGIGIVEPKQVSLDLPSEGFALESGERLKELVVAYETYGSLSSLKDNTVNICHALTGDAHVAGYHSENDRAPGWWNQMIGPGKGIDTDYYFVVCSNVLGGCAGTTGPSSVNPETGKPYGSAFPRISVADIVHVQKLLMDRLGIKRLAAVVGGSFGGMQVMEWNIQYPEMVDRSVCIATSASLSSQAIAFDVVARDAIVSDPGWHNGDYYDKPQKPVWGLSHARKIGHITYLSPEIMQNKFGRQREKQDHNEQKKRRRFEVENYLEHQGLKLVKRFDANSYVRITDAMDAYDLVERFGDISEAFRKTKSRFLVVALSSDWLFPPEQSVELADGVLKAGKSVSFCALQAPYGHDTFLVDVEHLNRVIRAFLPWVKTEQKQHKISQNNRESGQEAEIITKMVTPDSRVLDLGCGAGKLLSLLGKHGQTTGTGIDIDLDNVIEVINRGHDVFHGDIDTGLAVIPDNSFDTAVLGNTLQFVRHPRLLLHEMLRVAHQGIITFPNFGKWSHRLRFVFNGRIPTDDAMGFKWHDPGDIHLFTCRDFVDLCRKENIQITKLVYLPQGSASRIFTKLGFKNMGADRIIAAIKPADAGEKHG